MRFLAQIFSILYDRFHTDLANISADSVTFGGGDYKEQIWTALQNLVSCLPRQHFGRYGRVRSFEPSKLHI